MRKTKIATESRQKSRPLPVLTALLSATVQSIYVYEICQKKKNFDKRNSSLVAITNFCYHEREKLKLVRFSAKALNFRLKWMTPQLFCGNSANAACLTTVWDSNDDTNFV